MSQSLEDIWNNCIIINAKIGKHKTPWLFCTGENWEVKALSTYGGSKPDVLTQHHKTIAEAIEGFRQYLMEFLKSNLQDLDKDMKEIEEAKSLTNGMIDNLVGK